MAQPTQNPFSEQITMFAAPELLAAVTGWAGALSGLVAYGGLTAKRISPDTLLYQGLTLGGAALMGISATLYGAVPSAVVNAIWVVIGTYGILAIVRARRASGAVVSRDATVPLELAAAVELPADALDPTNGGTQPDAVKAETMAAEAAALADADRTDIALAA